MRHRSAIAIQRPPRSLLILVGLRFTGFAWLAPHLACKAQPYQPRHHCQKLPAIWCSPNRGTFNCSFKSASAACQPCERLFAMLPIPYHSVRGRLFAQREGAVAITLGGVLTSVGSFLVGGKAGSAPRRCRVQESCVPALRTGGRGRWTNPIAHIAGHGLGEVEKHADVGEVTWR